jgi:hypothetical protein
MHWVWAVFSLAALHQDQQVCAGAGHTLEPLRCRHTEERRPQTESGGASPARKRPRYRKAAGLHGAGPTEELPKPACSAAGDLTARATRGDSCTLLFWEQSIRDAHCNRDLPASEHPAQRRFTQLGRCAS